MASSTAPPTLYPTCPSAALNRAPSRSQSLRISLVQFDPAPPNPSDHAQGPLANLAKAHSFVRQAAQAGSNLVVFPEYFLSGIIADVDSDAVHKHYTQLPHAEHAEHRTELATPDTETDSEPVGPWLESFKQLAIECKIDICPGTIVERHTVDSSATSEKGQSTSSPAPPQLKNVAHYITKEGDIIGRYEKRNLWWPEKDYLTQGTAEHQVFETSYGRVGMLVCWDLAWPEASRALLLAGCDVVIAPTCWLATDATETGLARDPDSEKKFLNALIPLRAWENECCVVFCNCGGDEDQGWLGQTGVAVPFQGWIGQAVGSKEQMITVDIDLSILKDAREVYGIRRDLVTKLEAAGKMPIGAGINRD